MKQKLWLAAQVIIFALVGVGLLPGCAPLAQTGVLPTLKIGLVAPFEGLHRPLGYEALFGVKLALQERNQGQGLHGYRVELVALNDFDDPAEARQQARVLAADPDVLGVVGHLSTAATLAAAPVYQQAGLALSVPWTIAWDGFPAGQGVVSVAAAESETSARLERLSREMGFREVFRLDKDHTGELPAQAQAVELAVDAVTAGSLILSLQAAGVKLPLLGQVEAGSFQLLQVAGEAANGLTYVSPGPDPRHTAGAETFVEKYSALAGFAPGPRAVLAYDAANILLDALGQVIASGKPVTRAEVSALLTAVERQGLSGDITFDGQGGRVDAPVWVYQIVDEQYPGVMIAPPSKR